MEYVTELLKKGPSLAYAILSDDITSSVDNDPEDIAAISRICQALSKTDKKNP